MSSYRIKGWEKFQHFKDRMPPWVKLYRELLDDLDWHNLEAESAKVLVMLWLIASEDKDREGKLPNTKKLAFRLRIQEQKLKQTLTKLEHWLICDDIVTISERYRGDAPETETETETEAYICSPSAEVLDYLNQKALSKFRPVPANIKLIESRLKEGATVEEMKRVIDTMVVKWIDDEKMREYLRPSTLFNATKYSQYSGLAAPKQKIRMVSL